MNAILTCDFLISQPGLEGRNCIADEHYLPTFFQVRISIVMQFPVLTVLNLWLIGLCLWTVVQMVDPGGIANWSVTHVDWSERKWHPKSYRAHHVTYELWRNITV